MTGCSVMAGDVKVAILFGFGINCDRRLRQYSIGGLQAKECTLTTLLTEIETSEFHILASQRILLR